MTASRQRESMKRVSYWLMPAGPDQKTLSQIIRELAARYHGPVFDPHVTIYSGPLQESDEVQEIVTEATATFSAFTLNATGIAHSGQFTKTLCFEFAEHETLTRLSHILRQRMSARAEYVLRPHLSLIYALLSEETRRKAATEVGLPSAIHFDGIRAIRHYGVSTRRDVEAWETVAERNFKGEGRFGELTHDEGE